jgi:ATP-dependent helicase/nuclease subunit B
MEGAGTAADDPREARSERAQDVLRPAPQGAPLVPQQVSASSYEDLRRCPYRFFALRMLGLREADEIEAEVDKRDFGTWLHGVLKSFHEALREQGHLSRPERVRLLDAIAGAGIADQRLGEGNSCRLPPPGPPCAKATWTGWRSTKRRARCSKRERATTRCSWTR